MATRETRVSSKRGRRATAVRSGKFHSETLMSQYQENRVGGSSHLTSLVCLFSTNFQLAVEQLEGFLGGVCVRDVSVGG